MNLDGGLSFVLWERVVIFLAMPASIWSSTNPSTAKDDVIREVGVQVNNVAENVSMHSLISLKRLSSEYVIFRVPECSCCEEGSATPQKKSSRSPVNVGGNGGKGYVLEELRWVLRVLRHFALLSHYVWSWVRGAVEPQDLSVSANVATGDERDRIKVFIETRFVHALFEFQS